MVQNDVTAKKFYEQMPNIDQEPTHRIGEKLYDKFDAEEFKRLTADSFFQKLKHHKIPNQIAEDTYYQNLVRMA
jgi:hypothetical protein